MPPYSERRSGSSSEPATFTVLYEDNHLIAVFKPAGVLTQGDRSGDCSIMDMTKDFLKQKYAKPGNVFLGLIHRLDRPVAGVVLFAKTSKGASRLSEQFRSREVEKTYWARVQGCPAPPSQTLTHYLRPETTGTVTIAEAEFAGAKFSRLHFETLVSGDEGALLEISLETGRKHQIRAQLSAAGHPILGDRKYGGGAWKGEGIALVAKRLSFRHPVQRGERITLEVPEHLVPLRKKGS